MLRATTKEQKAVKEPGSGACNTTRQRGSGVKVSFSNTATRLGQARRRKYGKVSQEERPECAKAREKQGCETFPSELCIWLSTSEAEGGCDYKREVRLEGFSRVLERVYEWTEQCKR